MCCTARTFYNWIEDGITADVPGERDILNIDLRRKVKYKPRKKKPKEGAGVPREALAGRTHDDFKALDEKERMSAVEADCVVGRLGVDSQVILTLLFRVSVNLFFTSFANQTRRSRKGGFTGCANVFSPVPATPWRARPSAGPSACRTCRLS